MFDSSAEKFLKANGIIDRSSEARAQILGCLGCQWKRNDAESVHAYRIQKCRGISPGTLYPMFQALEQGGVVTSTWEEKDRLEDSTGRPLRKEYTPVESELGEAFVDSLPAIAECLLQDNQ